jgi:uncharacterized membrane protein
MNSHIIAVVVWIHLVAVVSWLGLIISSALVFLPSMGRLDLAGMRAILHSFHKKTIVLSTIAVIILVAAGIILTVTNGSDAGTTHLFANPWMRLIVSKHVLVGAMVLLQAWSLFILQPRLIKLVESPPSEISEPSIKRLMRLNSLAAILSSILGCGVLLIIAIVLQFY